MITFDLFDYLLPHPDLLSIHLSLMRVAHAAGAAALEESGFDPPGEGDLEQERDERSPDGDLSYTLRVKSLVTTTT